MTLYELTRKLVARGCPEHPRLKHKRSSHSSFWTLYDRHADFEDRHPGYNLTCAEDVLRDQDATDLWTAHALEWLMRIAPHMIVVRDEAGWAIDKLVSTYDQPSNQIIECSPVTNGRAATLLEAIEAATRHLEPTNAKA